MLRRLVGGAPARPDATPPQGTPPPAPTLGSADPAAAPAGVHPPVGVLRRTAHATLLGLDATLGLNGLPQSGTGQASLLTGLNGAAIFGRHAGPWVPTVLRPIVRGESVLARAAAGGRHVALANAYPEELLAGGRARGPLLRAGPPLAALGAGVLSRHTEALRRGDAVASDIVNAGWKERLGRDDLPEPTPAEAGRNLAAIAARHDLTLFAHYTTDLAGHRGGLAAGVAAIERVDAFLGGVVEALPPDALLVMASDHGNLEDTRAQHTRNPALGLVAGPGHDVFAERLRSITDIAPALLERLGVGMGGTRPGS